MEQIENKLQNVRPQLNQIKKKYIKWKRTKYSITEKQRLPDWMKRQSPTICCLKGMRTKKYTPCK